MRSRTWTLAAILTFSVAWTTTAGAQDPVEPPPSRSPAAPTSKEPGVPLRIQLVVSRFQGEKKVSSLPYTLSLATNSPMASLRTGGKLPIVTSTSANGPTTVNYQNVGTSIDCTAWAMEGDRFKVLIVLDDSSVYPDEQTLQPKNAGQPSFSTFRATETVVLKDGQSSQYTAAIDKITGLVTRIDVTLTVLK